MIISVKSLYLLLFKEIYIKEDADEEQSNLACKLKNQINLKKVGKEFLFFRATGKIIINFKSRLFPITNLDKISTLEPTIKLATKPTKRRKSKLKLQQEFMNEVIANKKDISHEIF